MTKKSLAAYPLPALTLALVLSACAPLGQRSSANTLHPPSSPTLADLNTVVPALAVEAHQRLMRDVWKRPGLSPRDRSVVTVAAIIARNQTAEMPFQFNLALDNGVKPAELSEIITHLAFYSGWGDAMSAVSVAKEVFNVRGIGVDQLAPANATLLPMDAAAEATRADFVQKQFGEVAPGVVTDTTNVLFRHLWLRPALAPRDRSLVTVSALIASGQVGQIPYHLNRAMDNGLTKTQVSEVLTQLSYYAGWPKVFAALPVVKQVVDARHA